MAVTNMGRTDREVGRWEGKQRGQREATSVLQPEKRWHGSGEKGPDAVETSLGEVTEVPLQDRNSMSILYRWRCPQTNENKTQTYGGPPFLSPVICAGLCCFQMSISVSKIAKAFLPVPQAGSFRTLPLFYAAIEMTYNILTRYDIFKCLREFFYNRKSSI